MNNSFGQLLRPEKIASILLAIMATLIVFHVVAMQVIFNEALGLEEQFDLEYWQLAFFDLDEEESFGTWFSTVSLLFASIILIYQARVLRSRDDAWHRWWLILGCAFFLLSIDEVAGIHEWMNTSTENGTWTYAGFAVLILVGLSYLPFLWHYRGRTAALFIIAGIIFGGGAVGVEHFSGTDVNSLQYNMLTALEEGMEMLGVILLIYAGLDFIRSDLVT